MIQVKYINQDEILTINLDESEVNKLVQEKKITFRESVGRLFTKATQLPQFCIFAVCECE